MRLEQPFNGAMLALARQRAGLSQKELSGTSGVPASAISRIEAGLTRTLQRDTAEKLSVACGVPLAFFDRPDEVRHLGLHRLYRLQRRVGARDLAQLEAELNLRRLHLLNLLAHVELDAKLPLPPVGELADRSPIEAARFMRALWSIPAGPINGLTALLESSGIIVVPVGDVTAAFEGLAVHAYGGQPMIFVKASQPDDRRRFTLAHELAHLLLHPEANDDHDNQANQFAAEFLLPADEAKVLLSNFSAARAMDLKSEYRLSLQFFAHRAKDVGMLDADGLQKFYRMLSVRGWRVDEPIARPAEPPTAASRMVSVMVDELGYSLADLAELLKDSTENVRRYFGFPVEGPRRFTLIR